MLAFFQIIQTHRNTHHPSFFSIAHPQPGHGLATFLTTSKLFSSSLLLRAIIFLAISAAFLALFTSSFCRLSLFSLSVLSCARAFCTNDCVASSDVTLGLISKFSGSASRLSYCMQVKFSCHEIWCVKQLRCSQCRQVTRGELVASWWIWPEPQGYVHQRKLGDWDIAARMASCSYLVFVSHQFCQSARGYKITARR